MVEANVVWLSFIYSCQSVTRIVYSAKAKGDDHRSAAATLLREAEKNKLSSIERAWIGGAV